jgi:adenosine deaminase
VPDCFVCEFSDEFWILAGLILTRLSLQTDDVGFFCSPVSNEYLLAAEHFGLGRAELLKLCSRSVDAIFGGGQEKERLRCMLRGFSRASQAC